MNQLSDSVMEKAVIKWLLNNNHFIAQLTLTKDDFLDDFNKNAYERMIEAFDEFHFIDELTFKSLANENLPEEAIADIISTEQAPGMHYAHHLKRYANIRRLSEALIEGVDLVESGDIKALEKFDQLYDEARRNFETIRRPLSAKEMSEEYQKHWNKIKSGKATTFKSGYKTLDQYACWQPKKLYTIAARSSIGKSSLAQTMGVGFANNEHKTLFFSTEMDNIELTERMLSIYAKKSNTLFKYGNVPEEEMQNALEKFSSKQENFFLHWDPRMTINDIKRIAFDTKMRHGLDVVIVDYLQLIRNHRPPKSGESMHRFISEVTSELKSMAGELECAVIVLSQVTRGGDETKPPVLSQLKESGSIENDSDCVLILHRESRDADQGHVIIAKNRGGPAMGKIKMFFKKERTYYYEAQGQVLPMLDVRTSTSAENANIFD